MKKVLIASMIGMVTSGAYSMQTLTDGEMSLVEGQALLNFSKDNYAYTTSKQERVNFYKLGLDVEMELNTNIKSLQLGCGGINNSSGPGCDIEIHNLSLSGLPDNFNSKDGIIDTSKYAAGRAASSAKITNPFVEFAIKNGDQASTREIVGFRLGAQEILGLLSMGTDNVNDPNDGIRSFSGYMKMAATEGSSITKQATFGASANQSIKGNLNALGNNREFTSNPTHENNTGITVPSVPVTFSVPETVITGKRQKYATVNNIQSYIKTIPLAAGSGMAGINDSIFANDQLYVEFDALIDLGLLQLGEHANFKMGNGSSIDDLHLDITFKQALSMIHNVPLLGSGAYLSLQKEDVRWSGADVADVAQAGWWMSIQNPIQLGKLETANQVDISAVLPQVAGVVTNYMLRDTSKVMVTLSEALASVASGTPVVRTLNIDGNPTKLNPMTLTLDSQILKNQNVKPNCFGGHKFC